MVPLKLSFLTVLCAWLLLQSTCARTRVCRRSVRGALRAFFELRISIRGRKLQHTTIKHECTWRRRRVFKTWDPGEKNWLTVTVGAKRLKKSKRARQITITSWCPSSTTTALHSFATPGRRSMDSRIRSAVSLMCSLSKRRLCLANTPLWANAARSSSAISSSAGLLTPSLPTSAKMKINGKSFHNTQERADRLLWHTPIDHITYAILNRSGHGSAMGVYLGQVIDSCTPRN